MSQYRISATRRAETGILVAYRCTDRAYEHVMSAGVEVFLARDRLADIGNIGMGRWFDQVEKDLDKVAKLKLGTLRTLRKAAAKVRRARRARSVSSAIRSMEDLSCLAKNVQRRLGDIQASLANAIKKAGRILRNTMTMQRIKERIRSAHALIHRANRSIGKTLLHAERIFPTAQPLQPAAK